MIRHRSKLVLGVAGLIALACGREASPLPAQEAATTATASTTAPAISAQPEVASAPIAPTAPSDACIDVDADLGGKHITLEGRLFIDAQYEHPTRGKTRPYILSLDAPRCTIGIDEKDLREIQLAASDGLALRPLVGKHVRVSGDPFVAHTAWHARSVVLMTTTARASR